MSRKGNVKRIVQLYTPNGVFQVEYSELNKAFLQAKDKGITHLTLGIEGNEVTYEVNYLGRVLETCRIQYRAARKAVQFPKFLDKYLEDMSKSIILKSTDEFSSRKNELSKVWTFLSKNKKNNAILVGYEGVGKTALVKEAIRSVYSSECPDALSNCFVVKFNAKKLLDVTNEFKLNIIINYFLEIAKLPNAIVYIDNLFYMLTSDALFRVMLILLKENVRVISTLSYEKFEEYFAESAMILRYLNIIQLSEPDVTEIGTILSDKINRLEIAYDVNISNKMIMFSAMTGSSLSNTVLANPGRTLDIIDFALADAKRKGMKKVKKENILSYYDIDYNLTNKMSQDERIITAYHEVGHYIVQKKSENIKNIKNAFVSILPMDYFLGLTAEYEDVGKQLTFNKKYYIDEIAYFLGGRVGESLVTNEYSSGASQDLMYASLRAEEMILRYGLSSDKDISNKSYMMGEYVKDFLLTDEMRTNISKEVSSTINEAYLRAEEIINENRALIDEIVKHLLKDYILSGNEIDSIIKKFEKKTAKKKKSH